MTKRIAPTPDMPAMRFIRDRSAGLLDIDEGEIRAAFESHGALLLRGFEFGVEEFRGFSERLCPVSVFNESPDRRQLDPEANVQTVNLGTDPFPLHPELSREPWRPDACIFGCFEPPESDGQTTFCDGAEIVRVLPADLVEEMKDRGLLYIQPAHPPLLEYWLGTSAPTDAELAKPPESCPYIFRRLGAQILRIFRRPVLSKSRFGDHLVWANFLLFAHDYLNKPNFPCLDNGRPVPGDWMDAVRAASTKLTHDVNWQRGDVLVLDNSRFMHGRRRITNPRGRSIASYFGYLKNVPAMPDEPRDPVWRQQTFRPPVLAGPGPSV